MSLFIRMSPLNNVAFYPADLARNEEDGPLHPRKVVYLDSLDANEVKVPYHQPVCLSDQICIQFDRGYLGVAIWNHTYLEYYDWQGNLVATIAAPTHTYAMPGRVDEDGEPLYTEMFLFRPQDHASLAALQICSFKLIVRFGDGTALDTNDSVIEMVTNPVLLSAAHPGTSIISYSHYQNKPYTIFEVDDIRPVYSLRIPAHRLKGDIFSEVTVYEEQNRTQEYLDGVAYNIYKLRVGGYSGLPFYMFDILNKALACSHIQVNGDEMSPVPDSDGITSNTRSRDWGTYTFRDKDEESTISVNTRQIKLFTVPGYPFAVGPVILTDNIIYKTFNPYQFDDEAGLTAYLTANQAKVNGTLINDNGDVYYELAAGEKLRLYQSIEVFPDKFELLFNIPNTNYPLRYILVYPQFGRYYHLTKQTSGSGECDLHVSNYNTSFIDVQIAYASTGVKSLTCWHNNKEIYFNSNPGNYADIRDIDGDFSNRLQVFGIDGHDFSLLDDLDISFLNAAKNTLRYLTIRNSQLKGIKANWASSLVSGTYKPFPLELFDFSGNQFNVNYTDAAIDEFADYTAFKTGPYNIYLKQNPKAIPTVQAKITKLRNWGLRVDVDT